MRIKDIDVKLIRYEHKEETSDKEQTTLFPLENEKDTEQEVDENTPDLICVTSIFTYWSKYV